jgi:hypothetical protein
MPLSYSLKNAIETFQILMPMIEKEEIMKKK